MSAKTSAQPGRRTPLSLTGAVTKTHPTKGGNNAANSGGNNANGHNAASSNANKQDNNKQLSKTEQQQQNNSETKENPNKKQQQQADKKHQQNENNKKSNNEKNQNGVSSNKQQQSNENKQQQQKDKQQQQQQNKDKQQQNGNNDNKSNEKDKKEKVEKSDKSEKSEKPQEKLEKEDSKVKEDKKLEQDKTDSKKEDKKPKEVKDTAKDDKKDVAAKTEEQTEKKDDSKSIEENQANVSEHKTEEKAENMEVVEEAHQQVQQKSPPVTPKSNSKANKTATPVNKTPTKASEKTPQKSTPSNNSAKTTPVTKRVVTTAVDEDDDDDNDIEMEPLAIESSPIKSSQNQDVGHINIAPSATSTPGKIILSKRHTAAPKSDVQLAMQTGISPERPRAFSQISGRKSIRPISDYTPSQFQSNLQFRESYRRINTELDVTNTSMNVTVGSEVPNNLSFSFFGRGRKRDRTPPQHSQSAIGELQTDMEVSPPKRARLDMHGFFSAVSSPLSLLRNRFSKATLQSSTPVKLQEKLNSSEDEIEVQNVSGVSVHEEIAKTEKEPTETKVNEDNDATIEEEAKETKLKSDIVTPTADNAKSEGKEFTDVSLKCEKSCGMEQTCEQSDIKITETPLQPAVGDPMAKNKRCVVM